MATNTFVLLDVPSAPGTGVPSDISGLSPNPSLIVEGPDSSTGRIIVEFSEDGVNYAPATTTFPIHNPPERSIKAVGSKARVRRLDGGGPAFVALGSISTTFNLFATLTKTAVDTSGMGPFKTVVITGTYVKPVIVEASNDGVNYDVVLTLTTRGSDLLFIYGSWTTMRLRDDSDVPESIAVGSGFETGGPGGGVTKIIAGTNVTISPPSGVGQVTVNATSGGGAADHLEEPLDLNDSPLPAGAVVKIHGDGSFNIARADSLTNSGGTVGILQVDVSSGSAKITTDGKQAGILMDTGLMVVAGDTLWLSPLVFGRATNLRPTTNPERAVRLGTVKDASTYGGFGTVTADVNVGPNEPAQAIVPADSSITIDETTDNFSQTITVGQRVAATWDLGVLGVYALDSTRPDDSGKGFAIPVDNSAPAYQAASVAAGAVAKKTAAGLAAIFPRFGAGRMVEIQTNGVGAYDAIVLMQMLDGVTGYGKIIVRGTGTVASAGTTKFDGTALDCSVLGGTTGTGLNAPGYNSIFWPNNFGGTSHKTDTTDPAWASPGGIPLGIRCRFDKNTTTPLIRNECRQVAVLLSSNTFFCQTAFSDGPVNTDVFYAEQPGVVLTGDYDIEDSNTQPIVFAGIRWTGNITNRSGRPNFIFCTVDGSTGSFSGLDGLLTAQHYAHPVYGDVTPGGGLRVNGSVDTTSGNLALEGLVSSGQTQITNPDYFTWGAGCAANNLVVNEAYATTTNDTTNPKIVSNIGTDNIGRAGIPNTFGTGPIASVVINGSYVRVGQSAFRNCGGKPVFKCVGKGWLGFVGSDNAQSDLGTASVGIDMTSATQFEVEVESTPPAITGTDGDIELAGNAFVFGTLWTQIQTQEIWDRAGNHFYYSLPPVGTFRLSPDIVESFWNPQFAGTIPPGRFGLTMNSTAAGQVQAADLSLIDDISGLVGLSEQTPVLHTNVNIRPLAGATMALLDAAGNPGQAVYVSQTPGLCTVNPPNKQIFLGVIVDGSGTVVRVAWQGVQNRPATVEGWFVNRLNDRWHNAQWDLDYDTLNDLAVTSRWNQVGVFTFSADLPVGNMHMPSGGTFNLNKSAIKTVVDPANTLWAVGGYAKTGVTVNATDQRRYRLRDDGDTNWAAVGTDATINVIKYVFAISKNGTVKSALSTVSVDGLPHKFLIISTSTQILGRVDNEPWVVITNDIPTDGPVGNLWQIVEGITTSDTFDVGAVIVATSAQ